MSLSAGVVKYTQNHLKYLHVMKMANYVLEISAENNMVLSDFTLEIVIVGSMEN